VFTLIAIACSAFAADLPLTPATDRNTPFVQERATFYGEKDGLPDDAVAAIILDRLGVPIAATAQGLYRLDSGTKRWKRWDSGVDFTVKGMYGSGEDLWAFGGNKAARFENEAWEAIELQEDATISSVLPWRDSVLIGTNKGLFRKSRTGRVLPEKDIPEPILALAATADRAAVGTRDHLYLWSEKDVSLALPRDSKYSWAPRNVAALAAGNDALWMGSANGAGSLDANGWKLFTGKDGLPYDHFTCAAIARDGIAWFGTERGALWYDGNRWGYRASLRWLPNDRVNAIAVEQDGSAWIATSQGIAHIERVRTTLARKAEVFEDIIDKRHTRMGFVVRCLFKEQGNLDSHWINHTDNDGLYTSMYGAAEAFRYGATKDPIAKQRAKSAFKACKLLFEVTDIPGFPARSVVPVNWPENPNDKFGAEANKAMQAEDPFWKDILPRWPTSADGKYMWKCDTSSDEICGHYFFYAAYYDLVAETPQEKTEVRNVVRALTDHIVDNNFCLVDHDGKPTRWGKWSPEYCNSIPGGFADRGLQAVELFSFLNIAEHVTGDKKYRDTIKMLCDKYAYHINAVYGRWVFPPDHVVPWDSNLAFLSYYPLLKYEKDPKLLYAWRTSLDRSWQFLARQNDPFFNFVFAAVCPDKNKPIVDDVILDFRPIVAKAIPVLQDTPELLIGWKMENSHRLDVVLDPTPRQRKGIGWSAVTNEAISIAERSHIRINSDHFALDHEQGSAIEYEGTFYLLPYYMGLYHGFIK
jgi:hypothetical protein